MGFDRDFCDFLEYRICALFSTANNDEQKGYWCDGVVFDSMLDEKTGLFRAFTGKSGQEEYQLFVHLGRISAGLLQKNLEIQSCVPKEPCEDTFIVDITKKQIQMFLQ